MKHTVRTLTTLGILGLALVFVGCSDDDDSPTTPEVVAEVERITETFTGMFGQDESVEHPFTVSQRGDVELQITELQPVATLTVGMGFGRWDPASETPCTAIATDRRVVAGTVLVSREVEPGEYCAIVADVGNVFPDATVTYTLEVLHP